MNKLTIKTILLVAGLGLCGIAAARGELKPTPPVIHKTTVDVKQNVIIITGQNFGMAPPSVRLANKVLNVKQFSDHEVVAVLPGDIASGTYSVLVTSGSQVHANSNLFSAALVVASE